MIISTRRQWAGFCIVAIPSILLYLFFLSLPVLAPPGNATPAGKNANEMGRSNDVIIYAYHETEEARKNIDFFLQHGLHAKADFVFIMNGEYKVRVPEADNIVVIERENTCFDLGSYHEILTRNDTRYADFTTLLKSYKRYIFLNASIRGPFFPSWALDRCWSDLYFAKLSRKTKLVGMSFNCRAPFMQSMILATDRFGVEVMIPSMKCYNQKWDAVLQGEERIGKHMREAGYEIYSMQASWHARGGNSSDLYIAQCQGQDPLLSGAYEGISMHPYDTLFAKTNPVRWNDHDQMVLHKVTEWADLMGYSSYDMCK